MVRFAGSAELQGAEFVDVDMSGAMFREANLSGTRMRGVLLFGADAILFLTAMYVLLLWISIFNMALAFAMFNRSIGLFGLATSLIFPLYQGVYLKCARFFSYSSEIIFATSRYDDFVPPRVRRALLQDRI